MSDLKPALTAEEWEEAEEALEDTRDDCIVTMEKPMIVPEGAATPWASYTGHRHALAALCLHGQDFGFTWEDVDALSEYAYVWPERFNSLIERLEALLPPRERND